MKLIDVIFPFNLHPLAYICPDELLEKAVPGMAVAAPIRNKIKTGIILRDSNYKNDKNLKSITGLKGDSPTLSPSHLKLIEWISSYYFSNIGVVLASVVPDNLFSEKSSKRSGKPEKIQQRCMPLEIKNAELAAITELVKQNYFSTVLIKAPDFLYELSYAVKLLETVPSAIVLCPGKTDSEILTGMAKSAGVSNVVCINSGLTQKQQRDTFKQLTEGTAARKIIGTMSAVLSPLKNPSLIVVLEEQSALYKHFSSPHYNARDVAIMRAHVENIPVILMSKTPSGTSYHNAGTGKYKYLEIKSDTRVPNISVVQTRQTLSDRVISTIKAAIKKQHNTLVFINRRGHSIIVCAECGLIDECPKCKAPLVIHDNRTMLCHRCRHQGRIREICPRCKGMDLKQAGSGTQKIEEFILKNTEVQPLRVDSDIAKTPKELEKLLITAAKTPIVIGTKILLKRLFFRGHFDLIVVANPDVYFSFPDYLASERLYQDISALSEMAKEAGRIIIQTSVVDKDIYRFLRRYDYKGFIMSEINKRKQLHYPPYSRLANIEIHYNESVLPPGLFLSDETEVLGPIKKEIAKEGYRHTVEAIVKAKDSGALSRLVSKLVVHKNLSVDIDVDPVTNI
ncbi:MAG: primosomal protein N' [Nitrospirae bacterium YQR-1]